MFHVNEIKVANLQRQNDELRKRNEFSTRTFMDSMNSFRTQELPALLLKNDPNAQLLQAILLPTRLGMVFGGLAWKSIHTEHMESWAAMPRNVPTWGEAEGARVIARIC